VKAFYSDPFDLKLPPEHRFPMEKYKMLREALIAEGIFKLQELELSPLASYEDITRVHTPQYYHAVEFGTLEPSAQRKIGFPWSEMMLKRSLASVGGFLAAVDYAQGHGFAGNLSGGTHHSFPSHGEGFCVFNDFAVACLKLIHEQDYKNILVLDLDVHQGNGNAAILTPVKEVFVVSLHGRKNYPYKKPPSDWDVAFEDNTEDDEYLTKLNEVLEELFVRPWDMVLYQAGVDPLREDRLGKLSLSHQGLFQRDKLVFNKCHKNSIPVAIGLGGGYATPIKHSIEAHCNTYRAAKEIFY